MKRMLRKIFLGIAVVGTVASVVATGRERPVDPVVEPVSRVDTRLRSEEMRTSDIDLSKLEARAGGESQNDAFAPRSFAPAQTADAPARAARHEAPPLPFRYIGRMQDGGKLAVFLANGEESFIASAGQKIGEYRVDSISDDEIRFTYLPMKTKQVLPL
jgi:hypothetical protein